MGNKLAAKEAVKKFNIPMVPGTVGLINDRTVARNAAQQVGYPVLIKAAAGGVERVCELLLTIQNSMNLMIEPLAKLFLLLKMVQ
jgi:propionyl-CoA carboxylase alpha chain